MLRNLTKMWVMTRPLGGGVFTSSTIFSDFEFALAKKNNSLIKDK